jgi:hypothetical protein
LSASSAQQKFAAKGDCRRNFGSRSEKKLSTGNVHGIRKFDEVLNNGKAYFVKGEI